MRRLHLGAAPCVFAISFALSSCGGDGSMTAPRPERTQAADFTLVDYGGKPLRLRDLDGRPVVLAFWASWCGPCRLEVPALAALVDRFKADDLAVVVVSLDADFEDVRAYFNDAPPPFHVTRGTNRVVTDYGGIRGVPTLFVLRPDHSIHAKLVGHRSYEVLEEAVVEALRR